MNKTVKSILVAAGAILFFLVLSYGFVPQVLEGKIVNQSDISGYQGMAQEMNQWNKAHPDDPTYWTGSMFGGMPTTSISTRNKGDWTQPLYDFLLTGKRPATYLFIALLGAFLLLLAMGVDWILAIGGAVAMAFCSYNFQIIQVGHNTKMQAIAFLPWALAALIWTYRSALEGEKFSLSKTLLGSVLFALAVSMQVKANHQQITYYLALMILIYATALLVDVLIRRRDRFSRFVISSLLLLFIGSAGIATNVNKLLPLYKYTAHTMRGGSELSSSSNGGTKGLDLEYATAWSYGWEELPNLMIPNFNGGSSSMAVDPAKSETIAILRRSGAGNIRETAAHLPMYWGPQPFTAGPMYMGAITIFLFVLGLGLCRGKDKWWLLIATILAILLAVGNHFMAFTALAFKVLPFYNKFRTVSMALVILQFTLPTLGFLVLDKIVKGEYPAREVRRGALVAFAVTGGFCLLSALFPSIAGNFEALSDAARPDILVDALVADRISLLRADALGSFVWIALAFALVLWSQNPKGRKMAGIGIGILVVINMFSTGKRYLNSSDFITPKDFSKPFAERPVDRMILEDPSPSYRVIDLTVNVFNSSVPSYRHKNVGGYSPAKLQRYQDLIDRYLSQEINSIYKSISGAKTVAEAQAALPRTPILSALNNKYIIVGGDNAPLVNGGALGAAWFVDTLVPARTPDEEIALLGATDLSRAAILSEKDMETLSGPPSPAPSDRIWMTSYAPNELCYSYSSQGGNFAVFSEIWYPGWKIVSFDGEPLGDSGAVSEELLRADWTLRGAMLPAGDHTLVMRFAPSSYSIGEKVSRCSSVLLAILLIVSLVLAKDLGKARSEGDEGDPVRP